jgi:ankyrin repeat protein
MTMLRTIALLITLTFVFDVHGQTAPSPQQVAQCAGRHLAAHRGEIASIEQLVSSGADLNARDSQGRASIHIAAFASQVEVRRAMANAGADMNALKGQSYDVVTIAAVANDVALLSLAIELGNDPGLITSLMKEPR